MSLSTYSDLTAAVANWMARADSTFTGSVADFISLAEERIWRALRVDKMLKPVALTITAGTNSAELPLDWLEFRTVKAEAYGRVTALTYTPPHNMDELPESGNESVYTIIGHQLVYGLTVSADRPVTGYYYARPTELFSTSTNWLSVSAPSVYLYASLLEGAIFLKNSQKVAEFGSLYDKAIESIKTNDKAAMSSGSLLRIRAR
jgi:hypothetical protein